MADAMIIHNQSLREKHTFKLNSQAYRYCEISHSNQICDLLNHQEITNLPKRVLGQGSNTLFINNFPGLIIHPTMTGIQIIEEDEYHIFIEVQAAHPWDDCVRFCVENNLSGIENLSAIPGHTGAAPVQNIGAYGVEIKETLHFVKAVNLSTGQPAFFNTHDCQLSYRSSRFKYNQDYMITAIGLRLNKTFTPNTKYSGLKEALSPHRHINLKIMREAIIALRQSKLPCIYQHPNAGSFFKNPILSQEKFLELQRMHTSIPFYPLPEETVKVPAAWLIEKAGLKGKSVNEFAVSKQHALVLTHTGLGKNQDLKKLLETINNQVIDLFGIKLEPEVEII